MNKESMEYRWYVSHGGDVNYTVFGCENEDMTVDWVESDFDDIQDFLVEHIDLWKDRPLEEVKGWFRTVCALEGRRFAVERLRIGTTCRNQPELNIVCAFQIVKKTLIGTLIYA